jgi:O-antigen/teichoic acid export membrane protein
MDLVRGRLYQVGKGAAACVGDIAALLAGCLLFAFSIRANTASPPLFVAAWCVALSVGMVIMSAVLRLRPASLTSSIIWFRRDSMPLAKWLLAEAGAFHAGAFGTALAIQLFAGPAALGGLRVVQTLFAPLTLISPALSQAGLPRVVAALSSSTQRARDEAVRFTCVAVGLTALYIFASLSVPNLLPALFGASFKAFTDLIFPVALAQVVGAGGLMSFLLLRALRAGRAIATARLVGSSLSVLAAACTLPFAGIEGATWSLAASSIGGVAFSTFLMWKATQPLAARDLPRIGAVSEVVIKS